MTRTFSKKFNTNLITIFPGECYISKDNEVISTVLGSCISVCLYDIDNNIGGMNHFMLPKSSKPEAEEFNPDDNLNMDLLKSRSMRYGITAMDVLLALMIKKGAKRKNIKAKIFGGGNVLTNMNTSPTVGEKNIKFIKSYLHTEGIKIENENVSENIGRKIFFLTGTNSIFVKRIPIATIAKEEENYRESLESQKGKTDVTIF